MKYYILLLLLAFSPIMMAQSFQLDGCVQDSASVAIDVAVVSLLDVSKGTVVDRCITDEKGNFHLKGCGDVQINVFCLSYRPFLSEKFALNKNTTFPVIHLSSENYILQDVVVVGEKKKPLIKIEGGKIIYSPQASATNQGNNALEVLKKTPGVLVDGNDKISIGGRHGVLVMLNGKSTYMQKEELIALLRSTSADAISTIEVFNNPSARYDAEGSAGIININMKHKRRDGFFVSMNNGLSYWQNLRENTSVAFDYAQGKWVLNGNYYHQFGYYAMEYGMHRIQNGWDYYSPTRDTDKRKTISANLKIEYNINEKQILGGRLDINTLSGPGNTYTTTFIRKEDADNIEKILKAQNQYYMQRGNRYGGNLFYSYIPNEHSNHVLDVNYAWYDGGSGNLQPNKYFDVAGNMLENNLYRSVNNRDIHLFASSYDYQNHCWGGDLNMGGKYVLVDADNKFQFYDIKEDKIETIDNHLSNMFRYKEQMVAGYLSYAHPIGEKVNIELGLRAEYSFNRGQLTSFDAQQNKDNHLDRFYLFPSLRLDYHISELQSLLLNYGRRIDRPAYQDLNPFEYLLDELSYWKGNPFLKPQLTQHAGISYTYKNSMLGVSFDYVDDYSAQITDVMSLNKVVMTPKNIGKQYRVGVDFTYQGKWSQWWRYGCNVTASYTKNDIAFDKYRKFNLSNYSASVSL